MSNAGTLITYKIVEDRGDKLKSAARLACNFWNHFIEPEHSVVIHVGVFWSPLSYVARSYEPESKSGVVHGCIRFNTRYLAKYTQWQIAATLVHELGHTLGFGWDRWMALFDAQSGRFLDDAIQQLPALNDMRVETDYGEGTQHLHWDEHKHGGELMTGIENKEEYVLPVTIAVTELLGHTVVRPLGAKTPIKTLLSDLSGTTFTRREEAKQLAAHTFTARRVWERLQEWVQVSGAKPRPKFKKPMLKKLKRA